MVKQLADKAAWDAEVAATAAAGKKLVVDFTATWCGPCKMIGPTFVAMAESGDYPNLVFVKVDVDENEEVAGGLGISAMPTFKAFDCATMDGEWPKQVHEIVGASEDKLKAMCADVN